MINSILTGIGTVEIIMFVVWVIVAVAAIVIEAETTALVSVWFAAGAFGGLICAAFDQPAYIQIITFVGVSVVLIFLTRPLVKRFTKNTELKTNAERVIGELAVVTVEIPATGRGEVSVFSQNWSAVSLNRKVFSVGESVVVRYIDGNKLIVDEIQEIELK